VGYEMLILFSIILLALQAALIVIVHSRLLGAGSQITRLSLVGHRAASMSVAMGIAALLALGLVLEGIAPCWLLVGVGIAWICEAQATIVDIALHLLDSERELITARRGDAGDAGTGLTCEAVDH
jgi:hypothetical protein